ncbi:MAG: efflux RND transporter periplasmic adaptor subunit [Bacteroidaceae bacterium]|nr:efflux RND transporter periplasmic adaptor subunit [Bacteroidaceae bacterium]
MATKRQVNNIILALAAFIGAVVVFIVIGAIFKHKPEEVIQGDVEVSEYRVSSKVPGRILELKVKEGDYVHAGDTLAILDAPEVNAKQTQALSVENAASAMSQMANNGARSEQIQGAYELWQQAKAGMEIAEKSYNRVQRLYDEGVMTAQKRDEALANFEAMQAQCKAAKSQYDMAVNGARSEERAAAAAKVNQARGAVQEVRSYMRETVQIAQIDGEVSEVFAKVGELVGTGSPIMNISIINDMWGTFNVREDQLRGLKMGTTLRVYSPALDKELDLKVYYIKDQGSYATWKATKTTGQYDLKTFEVKARPLQKVDGLRPGMSLIIRRDNNQ